ncbi:hypothetical protein Xcel_1986 [Xylanimonas cellulosilytica DSM 15894]|uniref:Uncharacterized protein n=1 Tax=Xylanimonas cellulosilytica (strain DSM 15894 / JCM 12276 / CECT 5975 / KCTC 9989 / LMG 20990 / NBRC 107835 / XIL07) TaxID=446471 RepID=D1BTM6_XYLCX|nr:DUF6580 family putative transport protein [Xylanimonas cellulosilytica]ACZ31005.1 hypothetical protein Xcel_1986 [Xylanimonas cellulosilytica DSM 15894]
MKDLTLRDLGARWWRPALVVLAVVGAVAFRRYKDDLGLWPNVELLTATAFLAAVLLRHRLAALVPLAVVAASDVIIGNTGILVFTWTAWAVIGLGSLLTRRSRGGWRRYVAALGFGIGGTAVFYLWTNFGVWAMGDGVWYARTWDGLMASYAAGLPFLRPQLLVNLALVPIAAGVVGLVERAERARAAAGSFAAA